MRICPPIRRLTALLGLWLWLLAAGAQAGSAKILLYHHVAVGTPASTTISPDRFEDHLRLIETEGYQVVPLARIVDALVSGAELDSRWVAITFDDSYESVLTEAAPRLADRGWPFTVFVATDYADAGNPPYLGWDGLRRLEAQGATIANHTASHPHMVRRQPDESLHEWEARLTREVIDAQNRLTEELEDPLRLFAYPFGELSEPVVNLVQALGFIAFGQQSGPVGATTNPYAIPRFPQATGFDSLERLAEKLRTEHLPVVEPAVPATVLDRNAAAPILEITLADTPLDPGRLTCFVDGQPQGRITWLDAHTFRVQAERPLRPGRSKYTCTAPHPDIRGAYYWHTHLYMKPNPDGSWYGG